MFWRFAWSCSFAWTKSSAMSDMLALKILKVNEAGTIHCKEWQS